jgi:uncharacterized repeat protein (TIGR01451 family)
LPAGALVTSNGNNPLPAVATLTVITPATPPALGKAFNQATINAGGVSTLTVTLSNPNAAIATLTAPLIDTLPNGVVIAPLPNASTTCPGSGVVVAVAGESSVTLPAGRTIPANGSCSLTVDVSAANGGAYLNTLSAGALVTSNGNNLLPAVATLTVITPATPPALGKAFNQATINAGGVSTLTVTLSNPNASIATLNAPLIDNLPNGVVIAPLPNASTTCPGSGVVVAVAGESSVTLPAGRTIPADGSCSLTVDVSAANGGSYLNTLPAGALVTSNGNNPLPAVATLTVLTPVVAPALGKAFNQATINAGGVSTLTVTLSNPNAAIATLTAPLIDTLPNGVVIAPLPNANTTCPGSGVVAAIAGGSSVTLPAGRTIPANGSCNLTVDVSAANGGSYLNTLPAGALVTSNGNNPLPAVATLTVITPVVAPALGKAFNQATINAGGVSTLTVTLSNPNAAIATLTAPLIDTLPNGVVIAPLPNANTTCPGSGVVAAIAGGSSVTLPAGRTIPANGSCNLTVDVSAANGGAYLNTLPAGALVTSNGNNPLPAVATLTVLTPVVAPVLGKTLNPATINAGGISTLTVTLSNANPAIATLTAPLIDTLPDGVVIAPLPNASTTCPGSGVVVAIAGDSSVTLPAGRTIPANGSCHLTVDVSATDGGSYINNLPAGILITSNGNNLLPAIATLTVITPTVTPALGKAFNLATINAGEVSTLTVTLSNANPAIATLTAPLIDTLPNGVVIAPLPNASTTCPGSGAVVAVAGDSSVTLPVGYAIPANGSCNLSVDVTAATGGSYLNTLSAGALITSNGNNPLPALATLTVVTPELAPVLGKSFNLATINAGEVSTLTVTLNNANAAIATLTAPLIDTLPNGVVIAPLPNASTTCPGSGAVVAVAGDSSVTLPVGYAIPANGSCNLSVDVSAATGGSYINNLPANILVTSNGNNLLPAAATLTVVTPVLAPVLGKSFNLATINAGEVSTLTVTLNNANATIATLTAPLIDTLPDGVVIAPLPNASTTCPGSGTIVAVAGDSSVTLPAGYAIPANGSCNLSVDVTAANGGSYLNNLPANILITSNGNNLLPAAATLTVITPAVAPALGKTLNPATINVGGVSTLTVTLSNPNASIATLTAPLIDTLPDGMVIAPLPNASTTCSGSGAIIAVAGTSSVTLPAGYAIPANGNCNLSVDVTAANGGSYINILPAGALVTSNGNNPGVSVATLTVVTPVRAPALGKALNPATINAGGISTLTVILSNPNAAIATLNAPLIDTLPNGVVIAPLPNASTTCSGSGAIIAVAGDSSVSLPAGYTIPANGSCNLIVDITAANGGSYLNNLPANILITSNGNNLLPTAATLTVITPAVAPALGKTLNPATINAGGISTLTVTLSNPNVSIATLTAPLIDTLPNGVVIAPLPNASTTCLGSGAIVAVAGDSNVSLPAGYAIPANGSCNLSVDVTAANGGSYINTLPAGALVTSNGNNPGVSVATLTVIPAVIITPVLAPALNKAFSPATINAGGISTLSIILSNPATSPATLTAALIDSLPSGVVIAPTPNVTIACAGETPVPVGSLVNAIPGGSSVTIPAGPAIPANTSCVLAVDVMASVGGSYLNTLPAGALVTSNGNNPGSAVATLTVVTPLLPPALGKNFSPATINAGGISTLNITFSNPSATPATLTAPFIDSLPSGVVIAPEPNVTIACAGETPVPVGSLVNVTPGSSTLTVPAGPAIPAHTSCVLAVNVMAAVGGSYLNTLPAGALVTSNGNNLGPVVATLTVVAVTPAVVPPTLSKIFSPATINAGGVSTLTVTLSNANATLAILRTPLIDTLPNGVVIAQTPNASTTCLGSGAVMAVAGGSSVTLPAGRTIPANGSCVLTVDVTVAIGGTYLNTLPAGALVTNNGNNSTPVSANLTVHSPVQPITPHANIPTLSEWGMIILAILLLLSGFRTMRKQAGW